MFIVFWIWKRISPHWAEPPHVTRFLLLVSIGQILATFVINDVAVQPHLSDFKTAEFVPACKYHAVELGYCQFVFLKTPDKNQEQRNSNLLSSPCIQSRSRLTVACTLNNLQ